MFIFRVLLERLIVNRPHPWGLLITFIELIKNPTFKFWTHEFVHCAPEIQKLFESVARSCMVASQPRQETLGRVRKVKIPELSLTFLFPDRERGHPGCASRVRQHLTNLKNSTAC